MSRDSLRIRLVARLAAFFSMVALATAGASTAVAAEKPLSMVVMDPLAAPLACACVEGYAQRKYDLLGMYLQQQLGRPVRVVFDEDLAGAIRSLEGGQVDLIVGKDSLVRFDAAECKLKIEPIARLTGKDGTTTLTGLFVVPAGDSAKVLADLKGYRILFGLEASAEKNTAAVAALRKAGVAVPKKLETFGGCSEAAIAAIESKTKPGTAAVISNYAIALLEGCGSIEKGELRVVGETEPVPFVAVFAAKAVAPALRKKIVKALVAMKDNPAMLLLMETRQGFVPIEKPGENDSHHDTDKPAAAAEDSGANPTAVVPGEPVKQWLQWRGANRNALVPWLPKKLSEKPNILWSQRMTGSGLAGIVATEKLIVVPDRDLTDRFDIWRCLDADTGQQVWQLQYLAPGELDYGNSPRSTPVIHGGNVYLLGAFGDLHCVKLADGSVVWKQNILQQFGAKRPQWGMCGSLLVVEGKLIVNPGAAVAAVVALDPATGKVLWQTPGLPAAYSSFIVGRFGGVRQMVGYDAVSLGGWNLETGRRLWQLVPPEEDDFNVPTPIDLGGKLFVVTENNGARVYGFTADGKIIPEPLAHNEDFGPDTRTPVVVAGKMYGAFGQFFCLDTNNGLKPIWTAEDKVFEDYISLIATRDRLLITSVDGELLLLNITADRYNLIDRQRIFAGEAEALSHPALAGRRLYVRDGIMVKCIQLDN